jgi:hypothetical protein
MGSIQVLALGVLPHAAKIKPLLEFGLQFVKGTLLEAGDDAVRINKELYLGWKG